MSDHLPLSTNHAVLLIAREAEPVPLAGAAAFEFSIPYSSALHTLWQSTPNTVVSHVGSNLVVRIKAGKVKLPTWGMPASDTNVSDLGPLRGASSLKVLNASGTPLESLEALADLTVLEQLDVSRAELTRIPALGAPPEGSTCPKLKARDTSLDSATVTQTIPMLCELGWIVQWSQPGGDEQACGPPCEPRP